MIIRTTAKNVYFLILDRMYSEDEWLAASGVRAGSPAAGIAARMYSCFFRGTTDITNEYTKYYKCEYRGLWDFLYWHYLIDEETIKAIQDAYKAPQVLLYGNVHAGGDYCVGDYAMEEDHGFPVVQRIFAILEGTHKT